MNCGSPPIFPLQCWFFHLLNVGTFTPPPQLCRGDALQANQASWKLERQLLASLRSQQGHDRVCGFQVQCLVHQLNLIRKPQALSITGFWATLVRLGHCFEQYSFRQSFASSLVRLLQTDGNFERVLVWLENISHFSWFSRAGCQSVLLLQHVGWQKT